MKLTLDWRIVVGLLLVFAAVGTVLGSSFAGDDLSDELATANARAAAFELRYDVTAEAYRALALQVEEDSEIKRRLREENGALLEEIEDKDATIISLQEIQAEFEDTLPTDTSAVEVAQDTARFNLFARKEWSEGQSFLEVEGPVTLDIASKSAEYSLAVRGAFGVTTVLDRRNESDLAVSVFFDNPAFRASSVAVINNLRDPLVDERRGFFDQLWHELTSLEAWRHRAEGGIAVCLATSCWR
jgi:hypothetical protein